MAVTRLDPYQLEPGASGQVLATFAGVASWVDPADVDLVEVDTSGATAGNVPVWTGSQWVASGAVATGGASASGDYVNRSGDTMTGSLGITNEAGTTASAVVTSASASMVRLMFAGETNPRLLLHSGTPTNGSAAIQFTNGSALTDIGIIRVSDGRLKLYTQQPFGGTGGPGQIEMASKVIFRDQVAEAGPGETTITASAASASIHMGGDVAVGFRREGSVARSLSQLIVPTPVASGAAAHKQYVDAAASAASAAAAENASLLYVRRDGDEMTGTLAIVSQDLDLGSKALAFWEEGAANVNGTVQLVDGGHLSLSSTNGRIGLYPASGLVLNGETEISGLVTMASGTVVYDVADAYSSAATEISHYGINVHDGETRAILMPGMVALDDLNDVSGYWHMIRSTEGDGMLIARLGDHVPGLAASASRIRTAYNPVHDDDLTRSAWVRAAAASAVAASGGITQAAADARYPQFAAVASAYLSQTAAASAYLRISASAEFASSAHVHDDRYPTFAAVASAYLSQAAAASAYMRTSASAGFASSAHLHDDRYPQFAAVASAYLSLGAAASAYMRTSASASFASSAHTHDDRYPTFAAVASAYLTPTAAGSAFVNADGDTMAGTLQIASGTVVGFAGVSAAVRATGGSVEVARASSSLTALHIGVAGETVSRMRVAADGTIHIGNGTTHDWSLARASAGMVQITGDIDMISPSASIELTGASAAIYINGGRVPDVVGSPSSGQVLTYNGLRWTPSSTSAGGISQGDADTRYVNVTGDTMTGALVVAHADGVMAGSAMARSYGAQASFGHSAVPASAGAITQDSSGSTSIQSAPGTEIHIKRGLQNIGYFDASGLGLYSEGRIQLFGKGTGRVVWGASGAIYGNNDAGGSQRLVVASAGLEVVSAVVPQVGVRGTGVSFIAAGLSEASGSGSLVLGPGSAATDWTMARTAPSIVRLGADDIIRVQMDPAHDEDVARRVWVANAFARPSVVAQAQAVISSSTAALTRAMLQAGGTPASLTTDVDGLVLIPISTAMDLTGFTTQVRLRTAAIVNATAHTATFTVHLANIDTVTGASSVTTLTTTNVLSVAAATAPAAGSEPQAESSWISRPSAGNYCLLLQTTAGTAANSVVNISAFVETRYVPA